MDERVCPVCNFTVGLSTRIPTLLVGDQRRAAQIGCGGSTVTKTASPGTEWRAEGVAFAMQPFAKRTIAPTQSAA